MFHKMFTLIFITTSLLTFGTSIADAQDVPFAIVTEGIDAPLTVAKVEELLIRTGEVLTFWVVTTAASLLPAETQRTGTSCGGDVENNGFKAANQTVVTKRIYSHNPDAQVAVLLILFIVCNVLFLFYSQAASQLIAYLGVSPTRQLGIELLRTFLWVYAYCEYG